MVAKGCANVQSTKIFVLYRHVTLIHLAFSSVLAKVVSFFVRDALHGIKNSTIENCEVLRSYPLKSSGQSGCLEGCAALKASTLAKLSWILDMTGNWDISTLNLRERHISLVLGEKREMS